MLYTRQGCHLCDVAREIVELVCADTGEEFIAIDVDSSAALQAQFTSDVPVVSVDGRLIARWRVDAAQLRRALHKRV